MTRDDRGFSLIELLVVTGFLVLLAAAIGAVLGTHTRTFTQQQALLAMEQNLRSATALVKDELRRTGYGVPTGGTVPLATWIPWVSGFTTNPRITQGSGGAPDAISIAACTSQPVARLAATASSAATTIAVSYATGFSSADLNTSSRRLIRIGDRVFAHVRSVSGTSLTIDVDPVTSGNQGLPRAFFPQTPICRVDVVTFSVVTSGGESRLQRNSHDGAVGSAILAAEGIVDLQIATTGSPDRFTLMLVAHTEQNLPGLSTRPTRTLTTDVTLKN
jgi:type II secretory pathway pseudopilin PulG